MKKHLYIAILLLIGIESEAQKMKEITFDKFTHEKRVLTDELLILNSQAKWPHLYISFRSVDTSCFITLHGQGVASGIIAPDDQAWILLDDDTKIIVRSTGLQDYDITTRDYIHQYRISLSDVKRLTEKKIVSIRRYYESNYTDIDITGGKDQNRKEIERSTRHAEDALLLAGMFYTEITKR